MDSRNVFPVERWLYTALFVLVFLTGLIFRLTALDSDPPLYFDGHRQSLSTDPYHADYFARNKVLFGQWETIESGRWRVFVPTVTTALAYGIFRLFGISRETANLPGVILNLLAILFFAIVIGRLWGVRVALPTLCILIFNKVLFVYGRLPYLENGMIFIMVLFFLVYTVRRNHWWGQVLLGILAALAALAGKLFGGLIIVPAIVAILIEKRRDGITPGLVCSVSFVMTAALWIVLFFGGRTGLLIDYYFAQAVGLYGLPEAFLSPVVFLEKLVSFGGEARFYFHAPGLGLAAFLGLLILLVSDIRKRLRNNNPLLFLVLWFLTGLLFFMPENYRPVRYIFMLYWPLAATASFALTNFDKKIPKPAEPVSWTGTILLFFLIWTFLVQVMLNLFWLDSFETIISSLVWWTAPAAVAVTVMIRKFRPGRILTGRKFRIVSAVVVMILVLVNFGRSYHKWDKHQSFIIHEAGRDLGEILNDGAVISGPMAPTLLFENDLTGMLYAVGISDRDSALFVKNPVTHFAIDAEHSGFVIEQYPELETAETVAEYWIRDAKVVIVRIGHLTGNPVAAAYVPTAYEIGRGFMNRSVYDSALVYMDDFVREHPNNKSGLRMLGDLYPMFGMVDRGVKALRRAVDLYPRDFSLKTGLGMLYQKRYMATDSSRYMQSAMEMYRAAAELNPYQADEIMEIIGTLGRPRGTTR